MSASKNKDFHQALFFSPDEVLLICLSIRELNNQRKQMGKERYCFRCWNCVVVEQESWSEYVGDLWCLGAYWPSVVDLCELCTPLPWPQKQWRGLVDLVHVTFCFLSVCNRLLSHFKGCVSIMCYACSSVIFALSTWALAFPSSLFFFFFFTPLFLHEHSYNSVLKWDGHSIS